MKIYAVMFRDGSWQAAISGTGQILGSYENKAVMVGWARAQARKLGGEVHIYTEDGELEEVVLDPSQTSEGRYQAPVTHGTHRPIAP